MFVRERSRANLLCVNGVSGQKCVSVQLNLAGDMLTARFEVHGSVPFVSSQFESDRSVAGLWDFDVVELFLCVDRDLNSTHYFEFQVSPVNQFFELEIFEPRKKTNSNFRSGFRHSAIQVSDQAWQADMRISLDALGFDLKSAADLGLLRGGAFAILGAEKNRSYWALNLPQQATPDFHLPQFFKPLF